MIDSVTLSFNSKSVMDLRYDDKCYRRNVNYSVSTFDRGLLSRQCRTQKLT